MADREEQLRKFKELMDELRRGPLTPSAEERRAYDDLDLMQRQLRAQAEVVAQAIELVAPVLERNGVPLRTLFIGDEDATRIEEVFPGSGAMRLDRWRALRATRVEGGLERIDESAGAPKGPGLCDELYLLETGALLRVTSVGTWHRRERGARVFGSGSLRTRGTATRAHDIASPVARPMAHALAIVRAEEVEPIDALRTFEWGMILMGIHLCLMDGTEPVRLEQLRALVSRAAGAVIASTEGLEAAVSKG